MKKLLLTLTLLLTLGFAASALDASVTFSENGYSNAAVVKDVKVNDDITITFSKAGGSTDPAYYDSGTAIRFYASNTITVKGASGVTITKVVFGGQNFKTNTTATPGTLSGNTWNGSAESFTITHGTGKGNVQIQSVTISYEKGVAACDTPIFSVADGAELFAGQTISVDMGRATTCELLVNGEPVEGLEYTIPEDAEIGSEITLTANSTLEGGDPDTATATINVTVIEKPVYIMFDYAGTFSNWTIGTANNIIDTKETATIDGVTMTVKGRHITIEKSTDLRIYKAASGKAAGKITLSVPAGFYLTNVVIDGENLNNTDASDNWTNSDETVNSYVITASGSAYIKSIKVYYAKATPSLVEGSTDINITHGKVAGVLTIAYSFEIANYSGNEVVVTATINGKDHITFTKVDTPAAAPAREATENGNWMERGTLTAKHEDLKGEQTLNINVKATLDGKELYNEDHTPRTTTGIEDVTVEGNEAAEYFNLQGIRVAEPQAGQVYIVRRGAKTTKELVK